MALFLKKYVFIWQLLVVYAFFWGIVIKFEANFSKYEKNFGQNFFLLTCRKKPFFKIFNFSEF